MSDMQKFDDNIIENLRMFSFKDDEQFYTNGVELVPLYRVVQILEHFKVQELVDKETPKKPLNIYYGLIEQEGICPNCNKKLFEPLMELAYSKDDDLEYFTKVKLSNCNRCGQAIDWSEDESK